VKKTYKSEFYETETMKGRKKALTDLVGCSARVGGVLAHIIQTYIHIQFSKHQTYLHSFHAFIIFS
jgi:hypothetical protein